MASMTIAEIQEFHDIVRLLEAHPEWRAELRRLILSDELLTLPQDVSRLTANVSRLAEQMTTLTEILQRMSVDVGRLKGDGLEVRYTLRGMPSVTRVLRRPHPLSQEELDTLLNRSARQWNTSTLAVSLPPPGHELAGLHVYAG
jgi:ATP phosphoribosyltransferase regulatory subunit HisZ